MHCDVEVWSWSLWLTRDRRKDGLLKSQKGMAVEARESFPVPVLGSAVAERSSGCSEPQNISRFCVRDLSVGVVL